MKKSGFLAVIVFLSTLSLTAQITASANRGHGENRANRPITTAQEMADKETQRETKMLNLTPDQVEKAKAINLTYSQQRADVMKEMTDSKDRTAMENKMQGIRLAQDNELKAILTAEQQTKLTKAHTEMGQGKSAKMKKGDWQNRKKEQDKGGVPQGGSSNN